MILCVTDSNRCLDNKTVEAPNPTICRRAATAEIYMYQPPLLLPEYSPIFPDTTIYKILRCIYFQRLQLSVQGMPSPTELKTFSYNSYSILELGRREVGPQKYPRLRPLTGYTTREIVA